MTSAFLFLALAASAADKLPDGPGRATVQRVCSACHAVEVFTTQAHDRQEWADIVTEMSNSGADATEDEFKEIVNYLAKNFPKEKKAPPKKR
jgi:competence protein ComEA